MKLTKRPLLIWVEGADLTGKSTLIKELNKKTDYKHTVIDRGPISTAAYALKNKRKVNILDYLNTLAFASRSIDNMLIIHCIAPTETILDRLSCMCGTDDYQATNTEELEKEINEDKSTFDRLVKMLEPLIPVVTVESTVPTSTMVEDVIGFIHSLDEEN